MEPPTLAELARAYLADPEIGRRVNAKTGQITNRRTAKHFADLVTAEYAYTAADARAAYKVEQQRLDEIERQSWQRFFAWLRYRTDEELITYIAGRARAELITAPIDHTEEQVSKVSAFDAHLYQTRLKCAKQHLAWRGLTMPGRATKQQPVTPRQRKTPEAPAIGLVEIEQVNLFSGAPAVPAQPDGWSVIARLQAAKAQREAAPRA